MSHEEKLKELIESIIKTNPYISEETAEKAYQMYVDDQRDISEISLELRTISSQIMAKHTAEIPQSTKEEYYHQRRFQELSTLYQQTKSKYNPREFEILEVYETDNVQSYNATKKVKIMDKDGNITYGFLKGISSPNEYELLVSRLGQIYDIPVAEFSMYFDNGRAEGISVSCNPDEERYEFILGYDFVSHDAELQRKIPEMRAGGIDQGTMDTEEIKHYIELFFEGVSRKVKSEEQLEQIKKDYLKMILFNVMIDQKDFNYTNFAILHDKETDSYRMAPLFDNGNIKDPRRNGTIIIGIENAHQSDVLDVVYSDYYGYIQEFSETVTREVEKYENGEESKISTTQEVIGDTLSAKATPTYSEKVTTNASKIAQRENTKKQELTATATISENMAPKTNNSSELGAMFSDANNSGNQNTPTVNTQGYQKTIGTHPAMNQNASHNSSSTSSGGGSTSGFTNAIPLLVATIILGLTGIILYLLLK